MAWGAIASRLAVVACFGVTALLAINVDLAALARGPPPPLQAGPGDTVTLDIRGWLDDGTVFLSNRSLTAKLGDGSLVTGLDDQLQGRSAGAAFNATLGPAQGYGDVDPTRINQVQRFEDLDRTFEVPLRTFEAQLGPPYEGEAVNTRVWGSVVVSTGDPVVLRYQPVLGQAFHLYRAWTSRVASMDNATLRVENLLHLGQQIQLTTRPGQPAVVARVTQETPANFTLDSNPALAGQRLHFQGRVLAVHPGTGIRRRSGMAVSLGSRDCASCHGGAGFNAIGAQASASEQDGKTVVNVTLDDPWLHEVQDIVVAATLANGTHRGAATWKTVGPLRSEGSSDLQLILPSAATPTRVELTINATAHHTHQSGGKPDDLPYQLALEVPLGAPRTPALALAPRSALVRAFDGIGKVTGLAALAVLAVPAVQGYRRHLRKRPLLRVAPWLTTHLSISLLAIALTLVHAEALMSGTWHGDWSWGVVMGAVALILLGVMGLTGITLAGWSRNRWPTMRRLHYVLMLLLVLASLVHVLGTGGPWLGLA